MPETLPQKFYFRPTTQVAKKLLGKVICHRNAKGQIFKGRIVETEAYLGLIDPAAHTFGDKRTPRTRSMYLDGGHSYIYFIYGMHFCLNVVTRTSEHPEAVLIRALEPLTDKSSPTSFKKTPKAKLESNGPGKLCRYLGLTKDHDGLELWSPESGLWIEDAPSITGKKIVEKPRVGVDYAGEAAKWPLRFYIQDNLYVSKK